MCIFSMNKKGGNILSTKAVSAKPKFTAEDVMKGKKRFGFDFWMYVFAFLLPALLTLFAYAKFGIYPFGSESAPQGKDGSVLALDLNGQYIYYFEAFRDAFWGDNSFFYSWSRDLSGEFMGIIGYYLASPFTLIIVLLPRTMILESLMIMQLCKIGAAGLTFAVYVRNSKGIKPLQSVIFSTCYAMMSYAVIQLIDPMWLDGIVFLPLIILGVEHFIDDGRKLNYIIPLAVMFIANFYIGYMTAIFVAIYFFYYLFFGTERKLKLYDYIKIFLWFGIATAVVLMLSAFMILPVYNALSLGKFEFSQPDYSLKTQFSPIELVPTLLPDQYYSVNMQGLPEIYCGVITLVLLPLFYMNSKIKFNKKIGYTFMVFALFFSMYIKPVDMLWHGGQTPNWLPYRYSFLMSFVLVSMAATVFAHLDGIKIDIKKIAVSFGIILGLVLYFDAKQPSFKYITEKFKYVASSPYTTQETYGGTKYQELWLGTLAFGMILAAFYLTAIYFYSNTKSKKVRSGVSIAIVCVLGFELSYNAYDTFKKVDKEVAYSKRTTYYNEIQAGRDVTDAIEKYDSGLYRSEKTFFRTVNDNLAYGMKGISHSSSVMNTKIINFIETMGYSMRSYVTRYDGNTTLSDSLLGIKYVVDKTDSNSSLLNKDYKPVFTQKYTNNAGEQNEFTVYQNPDALSIGYMVNKDILNLAFLGNDNPFNSQNMFLSTITGNTDFQKDANGNININGNREYYTRLKESVELSQCYETAYGDQRCFTANADATDPVINIHFTAKTNQEIYMYLKTQNEKAVNTWVSSTKDASGNFIDHKQLGTGSYFENHDYAIVRVGKYEPGTDVEVRLTIRLNNTKPDTDEYTIIKDFFIYQFSDELFHNDINQLKENQWDIKEYTSRYISGTIDAKEGQLMLTTIPSEPGWTVKVDGKKVDTVEVLKAFIGVKLEPGKHTVTMSYTPPGFVVGVITLIIGIGICILFYLYDRKNNKILIERIRRKKLLKSADADAIAEQAKKTSAENKKVSIIKSKGAVSSIDLSEADKIIENDNLSSDKIKTENETSDAVQTSDDVQPTESESTQVSKTEIKPQTKPNTAAKPKQYAKNKKKKK